MNVRKKKAVTGKGQNRKKREDRMREKTRGVTELAGLGEVRMMGG